MSLTLSLSLASLPLALPLGDITDGVVIYYLAPDWTLEGCY